MEISFADCEDIVGKSDRRRAARTMASSPSGLGPQAKCAACRGGGGRQRILSVRLSFRGGNCLFHFLPEAPDVEAGAGLHWRILDQCRYILGDNLGRDLKAPHLVLENVPVGDRAFSETV